MKTFYFLCSIPAAVAFWFGAQAGTGPSIDPQEPTAPETEVAEVQDVDVIVVTQDEDHAPRAVTGAIMPRRAIRTEVRSTGPGEPATFAFQGPVTAAVPAVPQVPGIAGMPGEHGAFAVTTHSGHAFGYEVVIDDETRKAMDKLKKAESDEDREEARDELRAALDGQYDKYLDRQEKELKRMEEKLDELKSQLEKRRDAKEELVDLRLKTLENDANGLGWPGGEHGPDQMIWRSVAPLPPGAPAAPGWRGLNAAGVQLGHDGRLMKLRSRVAGDGESKVIVLEHDDEEVDADDDHAEEAEKADADDDEDSDDDADDDSRSKIRRRNK